MSNINKCRVCLLDGAELPIFDSVESKESVHSKLFKCFKEKIKDIKGYPRNICESCNNTLHTVCAFIEKFKTSCELLESSLTVIKNEVCSDNDVDGNDVVNVFKEELNELEVCKKEPHLDDIESLDEAIWDMPLLCIEKPDESLSQRKIKLKSLKDINFKTRCIRKTGKVASSILEAEFEWNGGSWCLKSNVLKEPQKRRVEEIPKVRRKYKELKLPKLTTRPKSSPPSLCDICGEVFKNYTRMMGHKENKHCIKPVKCPQCPQSSRLYSDYTLLIHNKRVHDEKPFACDTCGKKFAWKWLLSTHIIKLHSKLKKTSKKYICEKCSKSFSKAKSLLIHERSAHTGLRPAQCPECGARFFHEDYLKEHIRLHTGETPFKCPICGRGYAQRGNMISHMTHNHRRKDLSAEQIKMLQPNWFKYLKKP